jgi:hypothetical protein
VHHGAVGIWRRKLKGRAGKVLLAVMFGLQVLHGEAGDPLLPRLPKPAEPYAADWERPDARIDVEGRDPAFNGTPSASGARPGGADAAAGVRTLSAGYRLS